MKKNKANISSIDVSNWYEQLYNNVHIGILIVDSTRHVIDVNQTFCHLFGYTQATEVVGQSAAVLHVSEDSYRHFGELIFAKVFHNKPVSTRFELQKKDGSTFWVRISGQQNQETQTVLWTIVDIDEYVRNENNLRAERDFSNSLVKTAQAIILVLDIEGNIKQVNPFMEKLTGYKRNEIVGKDWFTTFLPPRDYTKIRSVFMSVVNNIHNKRQVNPILTKNGRELYIEWNNDTLKDSQGNTIGVLCIGQDITQRIKADEEKERLLSAIDQSSEAIVIADTLGTIQYANPAFVRITGYTLAECLGENPRILKSDLQTVDFYRDMWTTLTNGQTWHGQFVNKKKDGSFYTEDATISPVKNIAGNIINYVAVKRDISAQIIAEQQRLELEKQLQQKHKMEAVGHMAVGLARNLNNNLSIILGSVELALLEQTLAREVVKLLDNAKKAIHRTRDLTNQLVTYSQNRAQDKKSIELLPLVSATVAQLRTTLAKTIIVQQENSPELAATAIYADAALIQEALLGLCQNSVRAMEQQGELKIILERVEIDSADIPAQYATEPGHYVKLSVQDTGCGISAEIIDKIFDPFFTTKQAYEGAGMGLATVQGIVAQHGGFIKVDSEIDRGTSINLYFPIIEDNIVKP